VEQVDKGRSTTNLYPGNTREVSPWSRGFKGCGLVVGGKGVYIWFPTVTFFGNIPYWDGILPKEVIDGWDHLTHALELGSEVA